MKIALSSQGETLDAMVDPRFGRCGYFLIVDPSTMDYEVVSNPHQEASGGAGIQAAQLVANKGVTTVITGNVGPNAFKTLQAAGIKVITGIAGPISEACERFARGKLSVTSAPNVASKFGSA